MEIIPDNKHIRIIDHPDSGSALILDSSDLVRDALNYRAIATNEAGEAETSADLKVNPAVNEDNPDAKPTIVQSLKDVITDEGQPLLVEASFTANPMPSVEWTKNGEPLQPSDRVLLTCDGKKVGLRIDGAAPSDAGVYGVTLNNPFGADSSQAKADVHKIYSPPRFTQKFTDLQQVNKCFTK